jgi:hypothetical protein
VRRSPAILTAALAAALASAGTAGATTTYLSTEGGETLAGLSFQGGDVVRYDDTAPPPIVVFDEDAAFNPPPAEEIDAFELLLNGNMILSTTTSASIGGYAFDSGDLIEYDPISQTVTQTIFFGGSPGGLFGPGGGDIDAVAVLGNGDILLSTWDPETLDGLAFGVGDVVRWDGSNASIYAFGSDLFAGASVNLDAFDVLDDGRMLISFYETGNVVLGGVSYRNGDLILYDPTGGGSWSLWLSEDVFNAGDTANIDAVAVPEPNALGLLALGLVGLAVVGRRR